MTDFDSALNLYSDLHKDVYGFRPRNYEFANMEELEAELNRLGEELEVVVRDEDIRDLRCWKEWNDYIETQARALQISKARMIEWDMQAEGAEDLDHYCWLHSLQFKHANEIGAMLG